MTDLSPDPKTRVLDAAELHFAVHGMAGARVAAIAKAANVNKAMLYYYFGSKEDLLTAVIQRVFEQILQILTSIQDDLEGKPERTIHDFLEGYQAVLDAHPQFARLMMRTILDDPDRAITQILPRIQPVVAFLAAHIVKGQSEGTINPEINPILTGPTLVSPFIVLTIIRPILLQATGLSGEALQATWRPHVESLLLHGLLARPPEVP